MNFRFKKWECTIQKGVYPNGRTRLDLIDPEDGSRLVTASLNIPNYKRLTKSQTIIKSYDENLGMLSCLQKNGIIGPSLKKLSVGLRDADIVELLV